MPPLAATEKAEATSQKRRTAPQLSHGPVKPKPKVPASCALSTLHATLPIHLRQKYFTETSGATTKVHDAKSFANALEQDCGDFGRIRGIANAAKHLSIKDIRPVANAPSHAANTLVTVMPAPAGMEGELSGTVSPAPMAAARESYSPDSIARTVYDMWTTLQAQHGW